MIAEVRRDNGRYLFEELTRYQQQYRKLTYIATGLEPDDAFDAEAAAEAANKGWSFERVPADLACSAPAGRRLGRREFVVPEPG